MSRRRAPAGTAPDPQWVVANGVAHVTLTHLSGAAALCGRRLRRQQVRTPVPPTNRRLCDACARTLVRAHRRSEFAGTPAPPVVAPPARAPAPKGAEAKKSKATQPTPTRKTVWRKLNSAKAKQRALEEADRVEREQRSQSVRTVSGGLPGLGKRRR